jgi:TonB family protein
MFRDKVFNLAILFSSAWHLFWISSVGIVVTPDTRPGTHYQEVSFLGPILEKTAFDLMAEEVTPGAETLYAKRASFGDNAYLKPRGPKRKVLEEFTPDVTRERFTFSLRSFIRGAKEIPLYFAEAVGISEKRVAGDEAPPEPASIEGPAGKREVIFKPAPPAVLRSLYGGDKEYIVRARFSVSPSGVVHDVEPIVSSGYPEIDLKAIRFLTKWRFSPLRLSASDEPAWGIVTVRIDAR